MDIECPTCGEPWDVFHMRHDEPHEWNLGDAELTRIADSGCFTGPADPARVHARARGWLFAGNSLLSFVECPGCAAREPRGAAIEAIAADHRRAVALVSELMDGDDDGLAAMLQDLPAMLAVAA